MMGSKKVSTIMEKVCDFCGASEVILFSWCGCHKGIIEMSELEGIVKDIRAVEDFMRREHLGGWESLCERANLLDGLGVR
ncbi:MAG: hypothetical protein KAS32_17745 [Candidatus Peribacteraceae bacterium]|nr:hypothetical protein [Candidatus Peribacteraceae bacterium]